MKNNRNQTESVRKVWLKGDPHTHSNYSDGWNSVATVVARAETNGLDFLCISDHDCSFFQRGYPRQWTSHQHKSDKLILLYGMEWTTSKGHAGVYSASPYDYAPFWAVNKTSDFAVVAAEARRQGLITSINHPITSNRWKLGYDVIPDAMEVWHRWRRRVDWGGYRPWDDLLCKGHRVTGIGGSDMHIAMPFFRFSRRHRFRDVGRPTTYVHSETRTAEGIIDAIRAGRVTITCDAKGPRMDMQVRLLGHDQTAEIGDTLLLHEKASAEITVAVHGADPETTGPALWRDLSFDPGVITPKGIAPDVLRTRLQADKVKAFDIVVLFRNGQLIRAGILTGGYGEACFTDPDPRPGYYRAELVRYPSPNPGRGDRRFSVTAMTNPVFVTETA